MHLASEIGASVAECKRTVSSAEFTRWIAEWKLEAFEAEEAQRNAEMNKRARRG